MTVRDNLFLGAYSRSDGPAIHADQERVFQLFPRLRERRQQIGGPLSGGEQQMLAIGRAMMARPKPLLLDEPSFGLAPILGSNIFLVCRDTNQQGTTILLIAQNTRQAVQVA